MRAGPGGTGDGVTTDAVTTPAPNTPAGTDVDAAPAGQTADPSPAAGSQRRRSGAAYVAGVVLLTLGLGGVVAVLASFVTSLTQAYVLAIPLLALGVGLERLGKSMARPALRVLGIAMVVVGVGAPITLGLTTSGTVVPVEVSSPVPSGAKQAFLRVTLGSGQLSVIPGANGLYQAQLRSPAQPSAQVSMAGSTALVELRAPPSHGLLARNQGNDFRIAASTALPWRIDVETGAATTDLDLREFTIRSVRADVGVGRLALRLGAPASVVPVDATATLGLVDIYLPTGTPLELTIAGLTWQSLPGLRHVDGRLETPGAATARHRYDIALHVTLGRVRLHWTA